MLDVASPRTLGSHPRSLWWYVAKQLPNRRSVGLACSCRGQVTCHGVEAGGRGCLHAAGKVGFFAQRRWHQCSPNPEPGAPIAERNSCDGISFRRRTGCHGADARFATEKERNCGDPRDRPPLAEPPKGSAGGRPRGRRSRPGGGAIPDDPRLGRTGYARHLRRPRSHPEETPQTHPTEATAMEVGLGAPRLMSGSVVVADPGLERSGLCASSTDSWRWHGGLFFGTLFLPASGTHETLQSNSASKCRNVGRT